MRRVLSSAARPVPPILRAVWRIRTLHPFTRLLPVAGVRPACTLDRVEEVTLARVQWLERRAA